MRAVYFLTYFKSIIILTPKVGETYKKKKKLQINIPHEHRYKKLFKYINKLMNTEKGYYIIIKCVYSHE